MNELMPRVVAIQEFWRGDNVIRYEDLLEDDLGILRRVLLDECGLDVPEQKLHRVVVRNRFSQKTGREPGVEAPEHLRKGVAGDWQNHFTDRVYDEFKARFGDPG